MSGIVALVAPAGETIDPRLVESMLEAQRHRGPCGTAMWIEANVALGFARLPVTPEAETEAQPSACRSGALRAVLDGRIDNRDELIAGARAAGHDPLTAADVDVLLAAYETWGDACAERLLGDFAFAIWDAPRGALICARDILGGRPLYVLARGGTTAIASAIAPLTKLPQFRREPDDGFVAECLAGQITSRTATVWRDITRVEPGHLLTVAAGRGVARRYWAPDPAFEIRYRRDEEYAEHLADLVHAAITPRLRAVGRIGLMLSGGIDSSSIAGAMHQRRLLDDAGPLATYSIVEAGAVWDETGYLDAVAAKWPVQSTRVPPSRATASGLRSESARVQDLPPYPNGEMANTLFERARADGVRVLLTGSWSDSWFSGSYHGYADMAASLQFGALWRHLRAQPDGPDAFRPRSLFSAMIWPLVPDQAQRALKTALRRTGVPPWVGRSLSTTTSLPDRLRVRPSGDTLPTRAQRDLYRMAFSGVTLDGVEAHERSAARFGLDTRHPFGDRRIVEFGLALPENQRWRGARTKFALRNAAREWLPAMILGRTMDGGATAVVGAAIEALVDGGLWQNSVMVRRGWVEPDALHRAFTAMTALRRAGDQRYDDFAHRLWLVCAVELWARHVLEEQVDV